MIQLIISYTISRHCMHLLLLLLFKKILNYSLKKNIEVLANVMIFVKVAWREQRLNFIVHARFIVNNDSNSYREQWRSVDDGISSLFSKKAFTYTAALTNCFALWGHSQEGVTGRKPPSARCFILLWI